MAQEQRREQLHAVVNQVKRGYFQAQQIQTALEATDEAIKFLQELDRIVQEQVTQRKALRADSLEVKTRLAEATHRAVTLDSDLASQKERLNDLLGREVRSEFSLEPVSTISATRADPETALTRALERRPSLKAARLRVQQAEHDKKIKALQYVPDFSVIIAHAQGVNIGQVLPNQISVAGVLLTWEFLTGVESSVSWLRNDGQWIKRSSECWNRKPRLRLRCDICYVIWTTRRVSCPSSSWPRKRRRRRCA